MMTTCLLALTLAQPTLEYNLFNGWWQIGGDGAWITLLRCDPTAQSQFGPNWVDELVFDGLSNGPNTRVERWARRVRVSGLRRYLDRTLRLPEHTAAVPLEPGHTLGQSFTVASGEFSSLRVGVPTWHTSDGAATLTFRRDGPTGEVLATRRATAIADNSELALEFEPLGPGVYYVELSEPSGTVGWWSSRDDQLAGGTAWADGQPDPAHDRMIIVPVGEPLSAELTLDLDGPRLDVRCAWQAPGEPLGSPQLLLYSPWTRDGYDVSPASGAVFSKVWTDRQRLFPAEQLKRGTINFGPGLDGTFVEFDGYANADLRVSGAPSIGYTWWSEASRLVNRLSVPAADNAVTFSLEPQPRDDTLPADWPSFIADDPALEADLNRFFTERVMSYPGGGSTPWIVWSGPTGSWYTGPRRDAQGQSIAGLTIDDDGYVYTWGNNAGWPFPDNAVYDTRHFDTNARFIIAAWEHFLWTGDRDWLAGQADRLQRAMAYQMTQLHGRHGLIVAASDNVRGRHGDLGNNYWDIQPFGYLDAYANAYFLASLRAWEQLAATLDLPDPWSATYATAHQRFDETFWDEAAGRYIGCVDIDGERHDYGFTFVNLEALAYGAGDAARAARIYDWLEHGTTWEGKADIYSRWIFAPRATTIHNARWGPGAPPPPPGAGKPWWMPGWHGTAWEEQCQDGGAILYTSYYDLVARQRYFGIDNAWRRFAQILARYREPDRLCGGGPLYRGEHPQQLHPGAVGLDVPFPESGLVPSWYLEGAVGVRPTVDGLEVRPALPRSLRRAGVRNLTWHDQTMTIVVERAGRGYTVEVTQAGASQRHDVPAGGRVLLRVGAGGRLAAAVEA